MRLLLAAAMAAGLMPTLGAQDLPKAEAPPAVPVHGKLCSGDDGATAKPVLLEGYCSGGFRIATRDPMAQRFFDNGMQLASAFAHKASMAAMAEAVRLDPTCAMCLWGDAWVSGPTINYPVDDKQRALQAAKILKAEALSADSGTALERELIAALKLRYDTRVKFPAANLAFARAMDRLAEANPGNDTIVTMAADAWLVASFDQKREALPSQYRSVVLLERVLQRDPDYTPAIHFYIHATEIAGFPARATPYADRLQALAPKASHLVHMPSHTYYWIGRYQDAADANRRAVALGIENAKRLGMAMPDGVWDLPYHPHNVHFGVGGALMSGDATTALALSDPLVRVSAGREKGSVFAQAIGAMGYAAEGRFAEPAIVRALPEPKLPYLRAFWHYARGEAHARIGDAAAVSREGAAIDALLADRKTLSDKMGQRLVRIAALVLRGRAAMLEHRPKAALVAFQQATDIEEQKFLADYADPPLWWYPVRRSVAEAKLEAGDAKGAMAEADRSLVRRPNDPMTLAVRARAATALGDRASARRDARQALAGWRGARALFRPTLS